MKQGLVRFWTCLRGFNAGKPTLSGKVATTELSEDEILGHLFDLRDRLAARPRKNHETILCNLGGSIAVELIRSVHGPVGTLSLTHETRPQGSDFTVDVIANASGRNIDWRVLLNGVPAGPNLDLPVRTWVVGSRRRVAPAAASAV